MVNLTDHIKVVEEFIRSFIFQNQYFEGFHFFLSFVKKEKCPL